MFAFLKLQPSVPASMSERSQDAFSSLPYLPSEAPSARVERTVSRYEFGRVTFDGVSWQAKSITDRSYEPGDIVKVLYRQDRVLWVDTLSEQPTVNDLVTDGSRPTEANAIGSGYELRTVREGIVVEVFTEDDLRDMDQASTYIDECNTQLSEKLDVLDHMEARRRLKMDELEAMVARL